MIEKIKLPVPKQINLDIIEHLGHQSHWNFCFDLDRKDSPPFSEIINSGPVNDSGFSNITYSFNNYMKGTKPDDYLNNFGNWIYHFCREKSKKYKIVRLERLYWNLYSRTSECTFHIDVSSTEKNYASIVYNLHDNDGGTEIKNYGFYQSQEREAIIFPSNILHKGVGPTNNKWRLSLNIVVKTR